ncbi:PfkB family carbohydrate kinase [Paenibacillus sp. TRM 82003]|uniref:PfkB family carbohydrate kinase n=1 Tax=Kineococcus sp. TRM81007 TaxID=2925831 RepID=UPI001F564F90|nr:PfkB family carbohydrate kinase [Kineococcus sp. TRM81007]MCI2239608.1 PfkB family carbohydrate kinase [Kineococcus sp. TRM81007]MCI3926110.1 PfkB family carbohydrate kinase [Paenibacillus sp. TRM 82003]
MTRSVTVLAPSPTLRVLVEPTTDGRVEIHLHPGGQGVWVARMAARLHARVRLCLPLGGEAGTAMEALLTEEGLEPRVVRTVGATAAAVLDHRGHEGETDAEQAERVAESSSRLTRHEVDDLCTTVVTSALDSEVLLLTGPDRDEVLPADVFRRLAADARGQGTTVVADLSGAALEHALAGGVDLLKVAHDELPGVEDGDGEAEAEDVPELLRRARRLRERGAGTVLVTRAAQPPLVVTASGAHRLDVPSFTAVQFRGAGDSMSGAAAACLANGADELSAVRTAAAAGAVNVTRQGYGTGHAEAVEAVARRVEVHRLD